MDCFQTTVELTVDVRHHTGDCLNLIFEGHKSGDHLFPWLTGLPRASIALVPTSLSSYSSPQSRLHDVRWIESSAMGRVPYPFLPVVCCLGMSATVFVFATNFKTWSAVVRIYSVYIIILNLFMFVNSIIWHDNVRIVVPAWCDISMCSSQSYLRN